MAGMTHTRFYLTFLLVCFTACGIADDTIDLTQTSPARFEGGVGSFAAKLKFPSRMTDFPIGINCAATVNQNGFVTQHECISASPRHSMLVRGVERALNGYLFEPAIIDGKPSAVTLYFSVFYLQVDGIDSIIVSPNLGMNVDGLGDQYISPQMHDSPTERMMMCALEGSALVSMKISDAGVPGNIELETISITDPCKRKLINFYERSRYIPARHNGMYVDAELRIWLSKDFNASRKRSPGH